MLELESTIPLTKENIESPNLTHLLSDDDLTKLGQWIYEGYQRDESSRDKWKQRTAAGMDLAMQISEAKNFPWPDCSNVAFPLVTIAVQQFHARAYPALVSGTDIVKMRVIGEDPDGKERARASRVSTHMSYQVLEEDNSWEEQHDRTIINVACVGTAFKKTYHKKVNRSELVMAKDLVLDYYAKSLDGCPRKTHIIPLFRNDIYEKVKRKEFRDILELAWYTAYSQPLNQAQRDHDQDKRHGTTPPMVDETTPLVTLEQCIGIDLDGDGYAEPYIVTIEENSTCVLKMCLNVDRIEDVERDEDDSIIAIHQRQYYTKYSFIPSPDGGIYDIGFGVLLGPLNESVNTIINQIIDASTINILGGGFLGRGAKIRGGDYTFGMQEWKRIDSTVDDLRKAIFPRPPVDIGQTMFQTLTLLIDYTNRISGAVDINVGENPGQNTPAETSRTMVEQGQKIYSAIYKRLWRSMKDEFKKLYVLNGIYLPIGRGVSFGSGNEKVYREDYLMDPERIVPAADPHITSSTESLQRALTVKQAAQTTPGYNIEQVERDFLRAVRVEDVDRIYPGPDKVPPLPNPKMQVEQMKLQAKQQELEFKKMSFIAELQEEQKLNQAKIIELQAKAMNEAAQAKGVEAGHQIAAFDAAVGALKAHNDHISKRIELMMQHMENQKDDSQSGGPGGSNPGSMGGVAPAAGDASLSQSAMGAAGGA